MASSDQPKKKKSAPKKKSLLAQLPKSVQAEIRENVVRFGLENLSLVECLARLWDFEKFKKSLNPAADYVAAVDRSIAEQTAELASMHPTWSVAQVRTALFFQELCTSPGIPGLERRIWQEDPAIAGQGIAVAARLRWLHLKLAESAWRLSGVEVWSITEALAVRDFELAERLDERIGAGSPTMSDEERTILAAYRRDRAGLTAMAARLKPRKGAEWMTTCLRGMAARDPEQVNQGLTQLLESEQRRRDKEGYGVLNMNAHGFYGLAEHLAPELVSRFDASQPFPWDAEFHQWLCKQESPLAGIDLRSIDPLLHDALVLLKLPDWWAPADDAAADDICQVILTNVGPKPNDVICMIMDLTRTPAKEVRELLARCPAAIGREVPRASAWYIKRQLETKGASAEIKKVGSAVPPPPPVPEAGSVILPGGLTPIAVELARVKAALGSKDTALVDLLTRKFHAEFEALDAQFADRTEPDDEESDDVPAADLEDSDVADRLAALQSAGEVMKDAKRQLLEGRSVDQVLEDLAKNAAIPAGLRRVLVDGIKDMLSDDEENADADDGEESAHHEPSSTTTADALRHLVLDEKRDHRVGFKYAYALHYLCLHLGEELPHDAWLELKWRWLEELDRTLSSAGVPPKTLSITKLSERGSPVPLPKIYHLPSIGFLTGTEIEAALAALKSAKLRDAGDEAQEYIDDARSWLQTCADSKRDLICFYV